MSRGRRFAVWALIALASLIGLIAILATWVNRQLLDDHNWQKASTQLIQDPAVQSALSVYLVNSLYDNVDVPGALAQRLPTNLKPLAAPAAAALRQPAADAVKMLLQRPRAQALWASSSTVAHRKLVNVLENKTGSGISTGNGNVTVDLGSLVQELGPDLGLPASALRRIPPNTGVITVMRSDELGTAQTAVQGIRVASTWLVVLVFAMYASAIYLATAARRETLRNIGWAFVLVGVLVLVIRRVTGNYAIDTLTSPAYREPARAVWRIYSSVLGEVGLAVVFYGLIVVLGAILAGPTRAAIAVRRQIAPILNEDPGIAWSATAFAFLLLVLWGGTHALRTWSGVLILGALLACGVAALRRQTLAEFPEGGSGGTPGSTMSSHVARGVSSLRSKRERAT